jgi:hypothetical protein
MVTPDALVMAPPARLSGLLPKNSAGRTQLSRNFCNTGTAPPMLKWARRERRAWFFFFCQMDYFKPW